MEIQTFSIVTGTRACNARCPFCVSRMTGFGEIPKRRELNARNFQKAALLAERARTTTVLLTGKGEPTLYPNEITEYLTRLGDYSFPLLELQTNALDIGRLARDGSCQSKLTIEHLKNWYDLGLTTMAISTVDFDSRANAMVYHEDYPPLETTIEFLHDLGYSIRLCVMMVRQGIDSPKRLQELISFCRRLSVEQLTTRPIRRPDHSNCEQASDYVQKHGATDEEVQLVNRWVEQNGIHLMTLMHGATIYDVQGQNVCISDCLTVEPDNDDIRTLIFYSNGRITYDWQHEGAILLGGRT